jgi:hypothetical protein
VCESCLESQCATQATACEGDILCSVLEGCLGKCQGDPACRATCVTQHRIGPDGPETQLASCLATKCAQPCAIVCGGLAQDFGADAAAGCQECILNNSGACNAGLACAASPECLANDWCRQTSAYLDRFEACQNAHDAGTDAEDTLQNALLTSCQSACALGSQWYCVGHPPQPPPTSPPATLDVYVEDPFIGQQPVPGLEVKLCSPTDVTCAHPLVPPQVTGDSGLLTFQYPGENLSTGPTGFLSLSGSGTPELFYWSFPLTQSSLYNEVGAVSQLDLAAIESEIPITVDLTNDAAIAIQTFDCEITRAPGVTFTIDPPGPPVFYSKGLAIDLDASSTDVAYAGAFFVNVPIPADNMVTVTAHPVALGRPSTVLQVYVQPKTVTVLGAYVNQ